jgi:endonuclease G|tara:strand:+ start:105 stop:806 length:702 start_codon:yes stop_codon:yes gene_type:complete
MEIPQLFRETRYGMPTADQILPNRNYLIGYSYLFRQPRWAMQVIDGRAKDVSVDREDCFRTDLRIPEEFRATIADYSGSGYDRGHLVPSADSNSSRLENSETFLISNMAPQHPDLNRKVWRILEDKVRKTALIQKVVEVYAISGPVFDITKPFLKIGDDVIVPHEFFKTILVEDNRGKFKFYSFLIPNKEMDNQEVNDFATSVNYIEFRTGLKLWDRLKGQTVDKEKKKKRKI